MIILPKLILVLCIIVHTIEASYITGANLAGWLIPQPWVTPSLFYRFLDKNHTEVAMDAYSLCEVLGPKEGNQYLRAHWESFVNETTIANASASGVEMIRLPIGDWTLTKYGPYVGCMDGVEDFVSWVLDICAQYNIDVWIDIHGVKGS